MKTFKLDYKDLEPLMDTPHTLIAGTTGAGKSVLLNECLAYLCTVKKSLKLFFDLKRVELSDYVGVAGTIGYVTEPDEVIAALDFAIDEMEYRFKEMSEAGIKQSKEMDLYLVIDELAHMVTIDGVLERLAQIGRLGRAANIHLLCCTQDPSRRTLPAQLMQNFTCTVALRCRSSIESRQIIGIPGAEALPRHGYGYRWDADGIQKFKIPYHSEEEIGELLSFLRALKESSR